MRKNILRICIVALLALAVLAVSVAVVGKMNSFVSEDGTELPKSFNIDFLDRKDLVYYRNFMALDIKRLLCARGEKRRRRLRDCLNGDEC